MRHNQHIDDNEESEILRDGEGRRVSMMMGDSMTPLQRAVAEHNSRPLITDGLGNMFNCSRPGYRFAAPSFADAMRSPEEEEEELVSRF